MRKHLFTIVLCLAVVCLTAFVAPASADVYMKQKSHTDAVKMMGQEQPAKDGVITTWLAKDKARTDVGTETSTIIRADQSKMYILDHAKKTASEMPLDELNAMASQLPEGMMKMTVKVTETDETKKIGEWKTKKYVVVMGMPMGMNTNTEIWATQDLSIDYDMFDKLQASTLKMQPFFNKEMLDEWKKVKGVPVQTITSISMMGSNFSSTTELLEVAEKSAPAGSFDVPEGYKMEKFEGFKGHGK